MIGLRSDRNRDIRMTLTTMSIELDVQESAHRVIWAALHQLEYVASIIIILFTTPIINNMKFLEIVYHCS